MECEANLVLTGFMGTGKSSFGRFVAVAMGRPFVDTDYLIEEREGRTIPEIFAESGEVYFRQMERQLCREFTRPAGLVIATGGGMLLPEENQTLMAQGGVIICLWTEREQLLALLAEDESRPLLARPDWRQEVTRLLEQRRVAYQGFPYHVDTTIGQIDIVVQRILDIWKTALPAWQREHCLEEHLL